jgi:hypothetical protein
MTHEEAWNNLKEACKINRNLYRKRESEAAQLQADVYSVMVMIMEKMEREEIE